MQEFYQEILNVLMGNETFLYFYECEFRRYFALYFHIHPTVKTKKQLNLLLI